MLRVSPRAYYAGRNGGVSKRKQRRQLLTVQVERVFQDSRCTYGSPRVSVALAMEGIECSENTVAQVMRDSGLFARKKKRFKITTDSEHQHRIAPNVLNREFKTDAPDKRWVGDITYIDTKEGWLYLSVVLDLFSRRVVGWSVSPSLKTELVVNALKMALKRRQPSGTVLHHSDRGVQYAKIYSDGILKQYRLECSMSRKGNCWDNAVAESFFKTLKTEVFTKVVPTTRVEAINMLSSYIELFYNPKRLHSSLGYLSPVQFERVAQSP